LQQKFHAQEGRTNDDRGIMRILILINVAIGWLGAVEPGFATLFCAVLKSPDGFVALRAKPSIHARLLARMRTGDEVQALDGERDGWQEVYHWHSADRLHDPTRANKRHGWARSRYVSKECR
jgi:Bacterial SH3 domain